MHESLPSGVPDFEKEERLKELGKEFYQLMLEYVGEDGEATADSTEQVRLDPKTSVVFSLLRTVEEARELAEEYPEADSTVADALITIDVAPEVFKYVHFFLTKELELERFKGDGLGLEDYEDETRRERSRLRQMGLQVPDVQEVESLNSIVRQLIAKKNKK